jgi:hypothetical protein
MKTGIRDIFTKVAVCALFAAIGSSASAQNYPVWPNFQIGPTSGQVVLIGVGIAAVGAGIGVGVYYAVRHNRSLKGCTTSGPNGLQLLNQGDQQTYGLIGEVADIQSGERVRISGKKEKREAGVPPIFLVERVNKRYGSCAATSGR